MAIDPEEQIRGREAGGRDVQGQGPADLGMDRDGAAGPVGVRALRTADVERASVQVEILDAGPPPDLAGAGAGTEGQTDGGIAQTVAGAGAGPADDSGELLRSEADPRTFRAIGVGPVIASARISRRLAP